MNGETNYVLITRAHQWCGVVAFWDGAEKLDAYLDWLREQEGMPFYKPVPYVVLTPETELEPMDGPDVGRWPSHTASFLTTPEAAVLVALRWGDQVSHQTVEEVEERHKDDKFMRFFNGKLEVRTRDGRIVK